MSTNESPDKSVLVIEDDPVFVKLLTAFNRGWGLPIEIRSRKEEIERAIADHGDYRVVISDCRIPGMEIFDHLASLRAERPDLDIVLMSSHDAAELRELDHDLEPAFLQPKDGIIADGESFAGRIRALLEKHAG